MDKVNLTHMDGQISIHNMHVHGQTAGMKAGLLKDEAPVREETINVKFHGQLGIQIHYDGRVWICVNGVAFLRFIPDNKDSKWELIPAQGRV